jgi:pyridoxine 5-phosphate synthase
MASLSANLNAIALLRNRRNLPWPDVVDYGRRALTAGARGLTVHPRPDQRHIRTHDVFDLASLLSGSFPDREFNVEGFPDDRFLDLVAKIVPTQVTLVPDDPAQETSDHGWDFKNHLNLLRDVVDRLHRQGSRVALFCDPTAEAAEAAIATGADRIEIYTGPYGGFHDDPAGAAAELTRIAATAVMAASGGMQVNAGHDLTLQNLPALVKAAPQIAEVSIGHGLTADCLILGVGTAVEQYIEAARPL